MELNKKNVLLGILAFVVIAVIGVSFTLITGELQSTIKQSNSTEISGSTQEKSSESESTNPVINPLTGKNEEEKDEKEKE